MFRILILLSTFFLLPISSASSSNFNYGSGFAAQSALAEKSLINAMEKVDDRIYAAGEHGIIIYSDDLGDTWTQAESVPYTSTITDLSCPTKKSCWVVGHDAVVLHSNDYGKTWVKQYEDIDWDAPLLSIHMFDEKDGIALGAFALSLRTSDGGKSWGYLFVDDDEFQPHLNFAYADSQMWRKSAMNEAYAVGELGKYYLSDDRGMSWMAVETGYEGSYWAGIKVDEGQSLLLGMSGNLTLISDYGAEDIIPSDKITTLACYESGIYAGECKTLAFERLFIGSKNSLTNAIILDDGRIAISGNGGAVSVVDLFRKKNIETCVRSDRLSNTSIVYLGSDEFLLAGENGFRKHSMTECYENFTSEDSTSQDSYFTIDLG
ncbi:hypothetical protein IDH31_01765 [Pelagibacterales bacterium SAG-MED32]|nr:hypothetical protein [Pelagibacterales bacterium SAG-MED32]